MAPLKKSILHLSHPSHYVHEVYMASEFLCNGCKTLGFGTRYRCGSCDFDLHPHCTTCPRTLPPSYIHPNHSMELVMRKAAGIRQNHRQCDVCGDQVLGLFYRCALCDFDSHPICSKLPCNVQHNGHPHVLKLLPKPVVNGYAQNSSFCFVCGGVCSLWCYQCLPCGANLHLTCVLTPVGDDSQVFPPPPHFTQERGRVSNPPPPIYTNHNPHVGSAHLGPQAHFNAQDEVNQRLRRGAYGFMGKLVLATLVHGMVGIPFLFGN
ncbi:hypothetical protein AMTRI_Chr08g161430 [Amborella trichopoda]